MPGFEVAVYEIPYKEGVNEMDAEAASGVVPIIIGASGIGATNTGEVIDAVDVPDAFVAVIAKV